METIRRGSIKPGRKSMPPLNIPKPDIKFDSKDKIVHDIAVDGTVIHTRLCADDNWKW